ncbi:MAG TPA: TIM barrel protein [Ktedonobacteraceae bacterium]|nr:TIM barrel protein [Ktedonobacteraceae bacterium]
MEKQEQLSENAPIYITANTLMSDDVSLEAALHIAKEAGADGFELRRELLPAMMPDDRVSDLRTQLEMFPSPPIYSTPQPLFNKGHFDPEPVLQTLNEAYAFGCRMVKFSPGEIVPGIPLAGALTAFQKLLSVWQANTPDIVVMVENDQSAASGELATWVRLFEQANEVGCPIGLTFDLGNWLCVGSDPLQAAQLLGNYVSYIHAKSVECKDGICISLPIQTASTPYPGLAYLPVAAPRAIEFPVKAANRAALITTVQSYLSWLRSGNFAL